MQFLIITYLRYFYTSQIPEKFFIFDFDFTKMTTKLKSSMFDFFGRNQNPRRSFVQNQRFQYYI